MTRALLFVDVPRSMFSAGAVSLLVQLAVKKLEPLFALGSTLLKARLCYSSFPISRLILLRPPSALATGRADRKATSSPDPGCGAISVAECVEVGAFSSIWSLN